jgi:cobalt-zinc-cadmium efflux system protein
MLVAIAVMAIEVVGGLASNSLALLSDAAHMFTDVLALGLALFAVTMACRPAPSRATFGYHRLEILAALGNGILLALAALWIFYEAVRRFVDPPAVSGPIVIAVALFGLAGNAVGLLILSRTSKGSLSVRGAALHVMSDALASLAVVVSGIVIHYTGWLRIDPILGIVIGIVIVVSAVRLLRESVDVLLESIPSGMNFECVEAEIREVEGVLEVHDLHIWCITSGMNALSGHVILEATTLAHSDRVLNEIKALLRERYGIEHTTIQVESERYCEIGEVHGIAGG